MIIVWVCIVHSIQAPGRIDLESNDSHTIAWNQHMQKSYEVELAQLLALFLLCLLSYDLKFLIIQLDLRLKVWLIPGLIFVLR